ncbi:MAG: riboflavin biosynthesis protein RibF [Terracidiphilus sp.]|jgi:riboflavin kinase/FMN adenylyltransferase
MISIYRSIAEIPAGFGPSVAAIGNFDGVHLGHQENLSAVVREAREQRARAVAITFDPHPELFLRPSSALRLLTPIDERLRLLALTGIDAVVVLPFNAALASLPAREFVRRILVDALGVRSLHEGGNFRFGHNAEAGVTELQAFAAEFGFAVHVHSPVHTHGLEVSSSAIREFVAAGDMTRARWMLGRPFEIRSTQARGRGIGARLLVPTVNLAAYDGQLPAFGVYVTRLTISPQRQGPVAGDPDVAGRTFQAVTNVGNRPTFGEASFAVESHILDFEPIELDDQTPIVVEFLLRLRGEQQWPTPEALKAQIFKDVARAKRYFRLIP